MIICYLCYLLFFGLFKKRKQRIYFFKIWKKTLRRKIHLHITLSQYTLSSAFREFINHIFPLQTPTHAHTNTHIDFYLLWHWTSSTSEHILFFLIAFISGNQALNKNLSNGKRQKTTSVQFRAKKKIFPETFGYRVT